MEEVSKSSGQVSHSQKIITPKSQEWKFHEEYTSNWHLEIIVSVKQNYKQFNCSSACLNIVRSEYAFIIRFSVLNATYNNISSILCLSLGNQKKPWSAKSHSITEQKNLRHVYHCILLASFNTVLTA